MAHAEQGRNRRLISRARDPDPDRDRESAATTDSRSATFLSPGHSPDVQAGDGAADDHALNLGGGLEDREVVRHGSSRPAHMPTIMHLARQESMIVDGYLPPFSWLSRSSDGTDAPSGQQH